MAKLTFEQYKRKLESWGPRGQLLVQQGMEEVGELALPSLLLA